MSINTTLNDLFGYPLCRFGSFPKELLLKKQTVLVSDCRWLMIVLVLSAHAMIFVDLHLSARPKTFFCFFFIGECQTCCSSDAEKCEGRNFPRTDIRCYDNNSVWVPADTTGSDHISECVTDHTFRKIRGVLSSFYVERSSKPLSSLTLTLSLPLLPLPSLPLPCSLTINEWILTRHWQQTHST